MKNLPLVFWLGIVSFLGAIFTRFGVRDYPGVPRPSTFLEFAGVCFLIVIVLILAEMLGMLRACCCTPCVPEEDECCAEGAAETEASADAAPAQ